MKKIIALLGLIALSASSFAGTFQVNNMTSTAVRFHNVVYHPIIGGPTASFVNTTAHFINPGAPWNPITPDQVSIDLTGAPFTLFGTATHYVAVMNIGVGTCTAVTISISPTATSGSTVVPCGPYTILWTVSGPNKDVFVTVM